jgi:hypothetical protein
VRPVHGLGMVLAGGLVALAGCSDRGGGPDVCAEDPCACGQWPDLPSAPVRAPAVAFEVWREGEIERYEWLASAGDGIACEVLDCEQTRMTLTFTAREGAPRLELEACGVSEGTLLRPLELASTTACGPGDYGVVMRWLDGGVWQSEPSSPACRLNATRREGTLTGTFECGRLRSPVGTEVRLGTGTFECAVAQ